MYSKLKFPTLLIWIIFLCPTFTSAQSIVDQLEQTNGDLRLKDLPTETIEKISNSKRIFIVSHKNSDFQKGDFLTIILNGQFAARALAAKTAEGKAGIKILKIYSLSQWKLLNEGVEVQILRGDDSRFLTKADSTGQEAEKTSLIHNEADLYKEENLLEETVTIDDNNKRMIKTDNVVTLSLGFIEGLTVDGDPSRFQQLNLAWSYQVEDNIWIEASYGQNVVEDFPAAGIQTKLSNIMIRGKYTFSAPFQSYLKPYIGFQVVSASSPDAGVRGTDNPNALQADLDLETKLVDDLNKKQVIFGVTVLKRLVPGWFFRFDLGTDLIAGGFGLEF